MEVKKVDAVEASATLDGAKEEVYDRDDMEKELKALMALNSEINDLAMMTNILHLQSALCPGSIPQNMNQKSLEKANKLREKGNVAFIKHKDCKKSLYWYTKSLAMAPPQSSAYVMAHFNRAAALKGMGYFEDSIAECQRALKANCEEELLYKIYIRQGQSYKELKEYGKAVKCFNNALKNLCIKNKDDEKLMKIKIEMEVQACGANVQEEDVEDLTLDSSIGVAEYVIPCLGNKVNHEIPAVSSNISLQYNEQFGRHFVATKDIGPGEVLMVEEPFGAVLEPEYDDTHCNHCMKLSRTLLPCKNCAWALYCSESCMKTAEKWHQHECSITPSITTMKDKGFCRLVARVALVAGSDTLNKFFEEQQQLINNDSSNSIINKDKRQKGFNKEGKYISSNIDTIANLCCHNKSNPVLVQASALMAANIIHAFNLDSDIIHKEELNKFLTQFILTFSYNFTCINILHNKNGAIPSNKKFAVAIYPTSALLNHSCFPNTMNQFIGKTLIVRASRTILKGEQVFTCMYGQIFTFYPKIARQKLLQEQAFFTCQCIACIENWPILKDLPAYPTFLNPDEITTKNKFDSLLNKLLKVLLKSPPKQWKVTCNSYSLFKKQLVLMDKNSKFQNQHYFVLYDAMFKFYHMQGNCIVD